MIKILTATNKKALNAGPKAKLDIVKILKNEYGEKVQEETVDLIDKSLDGKKNNILDKMYNFINTFKLIIKNINCKDIIVIQYPFIKDNFLKLLPKEKTIILIHDLMGLRINNVEKQKKELETLNKFKYIIVHNRKMRHYLEINKNKSNIFELELFDYLCEKKENKTKYREQLEVAYVGNLNRFKSPFIYQLKDNIEYSLNLYGKGIEKREINNGKIKYVGAYTPEELPNVIEANIGLVWDGNFDDSDENNDFKNYTKYNNPHKLSCYIAADLPVIVWKKSAIADFVKKYDIGFIIENLYDINDIKKEDVIQKSENVKKISMKVRNGEFTREIFKKVIKNIETYCKKERK